MKRYIADPHLRHRKILTYTKRPFGSVDEMDQHLFLHMLLALEGDGELFVLGDYCFNPLATLESLGVLPHPERVVLIAGNHEQLKRKKPGIREFYDACFGTIIGHEKSWKTHSLAIEDVAGGRRVRLLLSHAPQQDMKGCHYNLFGHVHNDPTVKPERFAASYPWIVANPGRYLNVSCETTDFRPMTLEELLDRPRWL